MIKAILILNASGKVRLIRVYDESVSWTVLILAARVSQTKKQS